MMINVRVGSAWFYLHFSVHLCRFLRHICQMKMIKCMTFWRRVSCVITADGRRIRDDFTWWLSGPTQQWFYLASYTRGNTPIKQGNTEWQAQRAEWPLRSLLLHLAKQVFIAGTRQWQTDRHLAQATKALYAPDGNSIVYSSNLNHSNQA